VSDPLAYLAQEITDRCRALPGPMVERENFHRAHVALHVLWTLQVGRPDYDKSLWAALNDAIYRLATDGPGERMRPRTP
jgi:hypothetical protein